LFPEWNREFPEWKRTPGGGDGEMVLCGEPGHGHGGGVKLHRILAEASEAAVAAVFEEGRVLDRVLAEAFLAHPKWGKRDRAFVAETAYETVRWRRALEFVAGDGEIAGLLSAQWTRMGYDLPGWWQWDGASQDEMRAKESELAAQPRAIRESVPDWLDQLGADELGAAWDGELHALNRRAPIVLRVNPLRVSIERARAQLAEAGIIAVPVEGVPDALQVESGKTVSAKLLDGGWVEIQDAGSQQIAPLLGVEPGMRVIDACAGAGGKTLHLATIMQNRGEIRAFDILEPKLNELRRRVARGMISNVRAECLQEGTVAKYREWADRVLLDVPCSGLGTLRRQPDLKWRLTPERLQEVRETQRKILSEYPSMLKPGGMLVYATCSVLPSENNRQAKALADSGGYEMLEELDLSPARTGWDGFYAALMKKL
jgi:16S rRNA (cytosine967-C5)-methyltransferase